MSTVLSDYAKNRDNNFNLIRFIAASLVLYTHSYALVSGTGDAEPLRLTLGMTWGQIAVDVFFVTSGFLIASSFFNRNNIFAFIWARILRIYPALIVAIFFSVFVVGLFFTSGSFSEYFTNIQTYKYIIKNITLFYGVEYTLPSVFDDVPYKNAINGSLWTLPYEVKMYFYLAIISTLILFIEKQFNKNILTKSFLSIAIIAITLNLGNHFLYILPIQLTHLFSMFFIGAAFYTCKNYIYLSKKYFIFTLLLLLISTSNIDFFFITYNISLAYIIFFIAYVPTGAIRNFNKYGDYSYGIYIYAFPIQQSVVSLLPNISVAGMILTSFLLTFIMAFFSWHIVEKKFLTMKGAYISFESKFISVRKYFSTKHLQS